MPVWAGFSARKSSQSQSIYSLTDDYDLDFKEMISLVKDYDLDAAGIMHCDINAIEGSIKDLQTVFDCPIMVYPETAVFTFPNYDCKNVISPSDYLIEAKKWKSLGAQVIGGCCGTSVDHIKILKDL